MLNSLLIGYAWVKREKIMSKAFVALVVGFGS